MLLSLRSLVFMVVLTGWGGWARAVEVAIAETQVHEFTSAYTGRLYQLRIGLPRNYDPANRRYTVVYQLDGQWDFDRVFPLTRGMEMDHRMEPVIVAAITYGGVNPDYGTLRALDYAAVSAGDAGETGKFLKTLRNEIIPLVEANYACRTEERVLMGSSYGGLFTCYALLHAPDLFTGYVASSPSLWVDNSIMVQQAQALGPTLAGRGLRVRIITGANEAYSQQNGAQQFYNTLNTLRPSGLDLTLTFAPDERHGAVAQVAYDDGLPEVLAPKLVMFPIGSGEPVGWSGAAASCSPRTRSTAAGSSSRQGPRWTAKSSATCWAPDRHCGSRPRVAPRRRRACWRPPTAVIPYSMRLPGTRRAWAW